MLPDDLSVMRLMTLVASLFLIQSIAMAGASLYEVKLKDIDGKEVTLADYQGKTLLIVNVASKCGLTKQYAGLEALYQKYSDRGLVVLGFPCNQFGGQEPGTNEEIRQFCSRKFNVTFPLFDKIDVNGANRSPLYDMLAGEGSPFSGKIKWNFTKFLIGRDGTILHRFEPKVAPDSPELIAAIEESLAAEYATEKVPAKDATSQISPELADRIAVLRRMLSELEDSEQSDAASSPHAERLQDPAAIEEAIRQLKEGKDICTRCLMVCGGAT